MSNLGFNARYTRMPDTRAHVYINASLAFRHRRTHYARARNGDVGIPAWALDDYGEKFSFYT